MSPPSDSPPPFLAPRGTLFLYEGRGDVWRIVGWDGSEACVPAADLEAFARFGRRPVRGSSRSSGRPHRTPSGE